MRGINVYTVDTIANIAVAVLALVAIIQTSLAIRQTKRDSFMHLVLTMYTECRKVIDYARIEDCVKNPVGLDCFKVAYNDIFRADLTILIDRNKDLSEQVEEEVVPKKLDVEQKFQDIVNNRCPIIGTYLSSVVSILALIDDNKLLDKENKIQCASYIKAQTTLYEKLWLHYYGVLRKENADLLYKYHIIDDASESKLFAIAK